MDFIDVFELNISNMKFSDLRDIIKDIIKRDEKIQMNEEKIFYKFELIAKIEIELWKLMMRTTKIKVMLNHIT